MMRRVCRAAAAAVTFAEILGAVAAPHPPRVRSIRQRVSVIPSVGSGRMLSSLFRVVSSSRCNTS